VRSRKLNIVSFAFLGDLSVRAPFANIVTSSRYRPASLFDALGERTTQGPVSDCDAVDMGTDAWRNWNAFNEQNPETENADDELYSDRHFVGGPSTHGPYSLAVIIGRDRPEPTPAPSTRTDDLRLRRCANLPTASRS
jgi:hypothetical protein